MSDSAPQTPACTIWLTGPAASGKTALGRRLALALAALGRAARQIDRTDLEAAGLGDPEGAASFAAGLLNRHGVTAVVSLAAPDADRRRRARARLGEYVEVHLDCSLEQRLNRLPAGADPAALAEERHDPPDDPDLVLATDRLSLDQCLEQVLACLADSGLLSRPGQAASVPAPPEGDAPAYTPEEEALVRRRLEALGYI